MGGGAGTRLFPLTKDRSKPAVPLGGKYRLVDIPISNCLNSGLRSIYVLTQFNTMSLHRHIQASYKFDNFSRSFVDILAAQQTPEHSDWYQGTADAVRQNMRYFLERPFDYYLILSGDQLYRMDFRALLHQHIRSGADITLATKPVPRSQASDFGIMESDANRRVVRFVEKPKEAAVLDTLKLGPDLLARSAQVRGRGAVSGFDGHLRLQSAGARRLPRGRLDGRLRQAHHSARDRAAERQRLHLQRLLGRHRDDPRVLRSESRPHRCVAGVQLLRCYRADLHPPAFPSRQQNQWRRAATGDHRGWLHHLRRAHRAIGDRRAKRHPDRRHDPQQHRDGRRLLRDRRRLRFRKASRRSALGAIA